MVSEFVGEVGDATFEKEVIGSATPVLVDFWAVWCGPCRAIAPVIEDLAKSYQGRMRFVKLNVDDHQDTAQRFGIRSIPTLLVFKGGKVVDQIVGAVPRPKLEETIKRAI
jgi:thioredoxin 1